MVENLSRRDLFGYVAGTASGLGIASLLGPSRADSTVAEKPASTPSEGRTAATQKTATESSEPEQTEMKSECPESEPGSGTVDTHVVERGTHRGDNDFTYFLDRASLGLDPDQPDEVYSRVHVKFDSDWAQPTRGDTCKIYWAGCNLSSGVAGQGGHPPTGEDGWSVRVYTRGPVEDGEIPLGSYVYHLDQGSDFGSLWAWPDSAVIGEWTQIDAYVKLNSVTDGSANPDGVVRTWLDGQLQNERTDIRWRTTEDLGFDRLGPGLYWGGDEGAPQHNVIHYDQFRYSVGSDELEE